MEMAWRMKLGEGAVVEFLGEFTDHSDRYTNCSPVCLLPLGVPQLIVHGTVDDRVPLETVQIYVKEAKVERISCISFS